MEALYNIRFYLFFFAACAALAMIFLKVKNDSEKKVVAKNTKAALDHASGNDCSSL